MSERIPPPASATKINVGPENPPDPGAEKLRIDALVSAVLLVQDAAAEIRDRIGDLQRVLARTVTDYEIVVVDNASQDESVPILEKLSIDFPNLQVYCLAAKVNENVARVAGIQQAIGDYVILLDLHDDVSQIPVLLDMSQRGNDLVLAIRQDAKKQRRRGVNGLAARAFIRFYRLISGYDLDLDAPRYRLMSRRLVNYVLQHEDAHLNYLLSPIIGGFKCDRLTYMPVDGGLRRKTRSFREGASDAISLVMFTSAVPLRLVTITCGIAGFFSALYSIYVVVIYLVKKNVAEGWTTLSLQLSLQFFLLSVALGLLSEYMVHILRQSTKRPRYYIAREFRSGIITREQMLNVKNR